MHTSNPHRRQRLARLETLESRLAPAIYTVTNVGDNSDNTSPFPGSLRAAIVAANVSSGLDTIKFSLPGSSLKISPPVPYPVLGYPVVIDGTTQPGYVDHPIIELFGGAMSGTVPGLYLAGGGSTVRGLVIDGFASDVGLRLSGTSYTVEGNYIGLDATGKAAAPNAGGIALSGAANCTIGGLTPATRNVISGNALYGVHLDGIAPGNNKFLGNYIGTDTTGTADIGNSGDGIAAYGPVVVVGGTTPGSGNLISGNKGHGIYVDGNADVIQGNLIGTDVSGKLVIRNYLGIEMNGATNGQIGGTTDAARNVISGNLGDGLDIKNSSTGGNKVQGNYIGTDILGKAALPNGGFGITLNNTINNTIGGAGAGVANIISGNLSDGVHVDFAPSFPGNTIQANIIGLNHFNEILGNGGSGISMLTAKYSVIANNVISANGKDGISSMFNAGYGSATISANLIGTDASGTIGMGNLGNGIAIYGPDRNLITTNTISANLHAGILLTNGAPFNSIQNNHIGTTSGGTTALGNGDNGVLISAGASNNIIGGTLADQGNIIAYNGVNLGLQGHGVEIASGTRNEVRRNSIHDNKGRGIDLNNDSFTINDTYATNVSVDGDPDVGANNLQDYPVLIARPQGAANTGLHTWQLSSTENKMYIIEFFANTSPDPSGFGEGETYLGDLSVPTGADGLATFQFDHKGKSNVSCTATDSDGNTSEFSMVDTDADGLADAWETTGIDIDENGTIDLMLAGADPMHKDLYVEVDAMTGYAPAQADLDLAASDPAQAAGFAFAPDALVHNPDMMAGVALHATLNETTIAPASFSVADYWADFDAIKEGAAADGTLGHFGTTGERASSNWVNIRAAKRLVFRYCLFAKEYGGDSSSGNSELADAGGGGGNDFFVTLGANGWETVGLTGEDRAGTFMHELGHTLDLRHGGGDDVNYKPNYQSVMNYGWQMRDWMERTQGVALPNTLAEIKAYTDSWRLDYSHEALPPLDESNGNLIEPNGIDPTGADAAIWTAYGTAHLVGGKAKFDKVALTSQSGAVDWNFDGDKIDNPLAGNQDINLDGRLNIPGMAASHIDGHEDWSGLRYYFVESRFNTVLRHPGGDVELGQFESKPAADCDDRHYQRWLGPTVARDIGDAQLRSGSQPASQPG